MSYFVYKIIYNINLIYDYKSRNLVNNSRLFKKTLFFDDLI